MAQADDEIDVLLNPSPEAIEEQAAMMRNYNSKQAFVSHVKGEERSRSHSLPTSPEWFDQPLRANQPRKIRSVVDADSQVENEQDSDDA